MTCEVITNIREVMLSDAEPKLCGRPAPERSLDGHAVCVEHSKQENNHFIGDERKAD